MTSLGEKREQKYSHLAQGWEPKAGRAVPVEMPKALERVWDGLE